MEVAQYDLFVEYQKKSKPPGIPYTALSYLVLLLTAATLTAAWIYYKTPECIEVASSRQIKTALPNYRTVSRNTRHGAGGDT